MAQFLASRLKTAATSEVRLMPVGDGTYNLMLTWGRPRVMFCTHMDTVPPYIPPVFEDDRVSGRGTCDAKGQIMALYGACLELERCGKKDFGLLLLAGEETGSIGAKHFNRSGEGCEYLIVGEPTDCKMASAAKGTKSFHLTVGGKSCHSGYPENGCSAVETFMDFMNALRGLDFESDPLLGDTTWNVGKLVSDNPKNILSDDVQCDIYFRTTFATDSHVEPKLRELIGSRPEWTGRIGLEAFGGDCPSRFLTFDGMPAAPVAFGSDAPQLAHFSKKILCGPGSILVAHTDKEYVMLSEIEQATRLYLDMYERTEGK